MRKLTTFKVGNVIKPVNEINLWISLLDDKRSLDNEIIVEKVIFINSNAHDAFADTCDDSNCIHKLSHHQLLIHNNGQKSSGYWFDPLIKEENNAPKHNSNDPNVTNR